MSTFGRLAAARALQTSRTAESEQKTIPPSEYLRWEHFALQGPITSFLPDFSNVPVTEELYWAVPVDEHGQQLHSAHPQHAAEIILKVALLAGADGHKRKVRTVLKNTAVSFIASQDAQGRPIKVTAPEALSCPAVKFLIQALSSNATVVGGRR